MHDQPPTRSPWTRIVHHLIRQRKNMKARKRKSSRESLVFEKPLWIVSEDGTFHHVSLVPPYPRPSIGNTNLGGRLPCGRNQSRLAFPYSLGCAYVGSLQPRRSINRVFSRVSRFPTPSNPSILPEIMRVRSTVWFAK